jgi:adenosylhomocysteine nucleosidase/adenosylhomocysteine/aminodeoxyfutalosine nucleosidase
LSRISERVHIGTIASADQDLCPKIRKFLQESDVLAADWESASIAKVCELNGVKCLILRGVSDIPRKGRALKEDIQERDYRENSRIIMRELLSIIGKMMLR